MVSRRSPPTNALLYERVDRSLQPIARPCPRIIFSIKTVRVFVFKNVFSISPTRYNLIKDDILMHLSLPSVLLAKACDHIYPPCPGRGEDNMSGVQWLPRAWLSCAPWG